MQSFSAHSLGRAPVAAPRGSSTLPIPAAATLHARPGRKGAMPVLNQAVADNAPQSERSQGPFRRWQFDTLQDLKKTKTAKMKEAEAKKATQIFIMLPMDSIVVGELVEGEERSFIMSHGHNAALLDQRFAVLAKSGAEGIMLDVWWGICERRGPKNYDFSAYIQLFKKARKHGLKVQAVMSFHAGGGNVGDGSVDIPLPFWVIDAGENEGDEIFYTDKRHSRDHECLSLGCDDAAVIHGRTPVQCYADYVEAFAAACAEGGLWGSTVVEICVGTGPCGELRYPAYQEKDSKWSYFGTEYGMPGKVTVQRGIPGIGEFQCYDKYMLQSLKKAAEDVGNEEWGQPPREGAGSYDFAPWETEFFALTDNAGWMTAYGQFFMDWYSNELIKHSDKILSAVGDVVRKANASVPDTPTEMAIKVAGIHWWYKSRSHAAEMTAGYYNHLKRDGYLPIAKALKKHNVGLSFTCIEMLDTENPDVRHCSPEGLVTQMIGAAAEADIMLLAENALEGGLYNQEALDQMAKNAKHFARITLLRMNPWMFVPDDSSPEGFSVKEPLGTFLAKFKKAEAAPAAGGNGTTASSGKATMAATSAH